MTHRLPAAGSIKTVEQFVDLCVSATNDEIYEMFENGPCTEEVRDMIYARSECDHPEPFRSAMRKLGFEDY